MKKSLILAGSIAAISLIGTTTYAVIDNTAPSSNEPVTLAMTTSLGTTSPTITSQDETVYLIADNSGNVQQTYIGSTPYSGTNALPVRMAISYSLDGAAISPADLAGRSGRVKISFTPSSTTTYLGQPVPFLAVTGLTLDASKFSNITLTNGKILHESDTIMIAGYSLAGMSLGVDADFLPGSFTIEADVNNFALGDTYTLFTNDVFANLDTSKLTTVDDIVNSISQLADAFDQAVAGADRLASGLDTAHSATTTLASGAAKLSSGADKLATSAAKLAEGLATIEGVNDTVVSKVTELIPDDLDEKKAAVMEIIARIAESGVDTTPLVNALSAIEVRVNEAYGAAMDYVNGVKALAAGAKELAAGSQALATNAGQLADGLATLSSGMDELATGSAQLVEGLVTIKASGVDKLASLATDDLANLAYNLRRTVNAARSYTHFANSSAHSVKFILKTQSIK